MTRWKRTTPVLLVVAFVTVLFAVPAVPAAASDGTWTIYETTTLSEDHHGTIVVGTSGVTLDCAGYMVKGPGDGTGWGIVVTGQTDVTIRNCVVKDHGQGIVLRWSDASRVENSSAISNARWGINLIASTNSVVVDNRAEKNGLDGFALWTTASGNQIIGNESVSNGRWGFEVATPPGQPGPFDNLLSGNTARNNGDFGFYLSGATDNTLVDNNSTNNGSGFALVTDSSGNGLTGNRATNNDGYGFLLGDSDGNTLHDNVAKNNGVWGFSLQSSDGNELVGNEASGNGSPANGPGFEFNNSSHNTVTANSAFHNGSTGFFAFFSSEGNVFTLNEGCRNTYFDGGDHSTGAGNTWLGNDFCITEGI